MRTYKFMLVISSTGNHYLKMSESHLIAKIAKDSFANKVTVYVGTTDEAGYRLMFG